MTKVLKAAEIRDRIKKGIVEKIEKNNLSPKLATIRLGESKSDISYENSVTKNCEEFGIEHLKIVLPESTSTGELILEIENINQDREIGGLLLFRPLPKGIEEDKVVGVIDPKKDLDGIHPENLAMLFSGREDGHIPVTPMAAIRMLEEFGYELEGAKTLIINRTLVVGKPLAMLLLNRNAQVTIAHSRVKNLKELCKESDIVFTAMGKAKMIDKEWASENTTFVDIGIAFADGKISGDLDMESIDGVCAAYTPVPGGVGAITNILLIEELLKYYL